MTAQIIPFPLAPMHGSGPACPITAGDLSGLIAHARRVLWTVQADARAYGDHAVYGAADDALAAIEGLGDMLFGADVAGVL